MQMVPQKAKIEVNFQKNDTRIFSKVVYQNRAQIETRNIYYLIPFNLESNDTKHGMVPNGSDPYGQVTFW